MEGLNLCIAYPNKGNYSETFVYNQIKYLSPKESIYEGFYPAKNDSGSILPFPFKYLPVRGTIRNISPGFYHKIYTRLFSAFLRKRNIEIVLAEYGPMGSSLMHACENSKVPFVVHFHGFDAYHYETLDKYISLYKQMFKKATAIVAVSTDMKEQLIQLGADENKVFYNPYGVDVQKFGGADPAKAGPIAIFVGRFTEKKAPYITIKAFNEALKVCPQAKLVLIGGGELLDDCKSLVEELEVGNSIEFRGVQKPEEIAKALQSARVFVQHSRRAENGDSEGTPNTILEASASGLPIISTTHAGIKDAVVHGETGFLVPEGDQRGMAEYLIKLLQDKELAGTMGQKSRKYIEDNFSMNYRIEKLKEILLNSAISNK